MGVRRRPLALATAFKRIEVEKLCFEHRDEDLRKAIRCAHIMGCDKIRVFTGTRVAEPEKVFQRVAEIIGSMASIAEKEKVYLLVEMWGRRISARRRVHEVRALEMVLQSRLAKCLRRGSGVPRWL